jgi:hypothetical protein
LAAGAKVFPKPLRAAMRKELTVIGRTGRDRVKAKILAAPSAGGTPYNEAGGLRSSIAAAVRVSATSNTGSGVGLRIRVAQTGALEAHNRFRYAQLIDKKSFPHKVYGRWSNPKKFVSQYSYFEKPLEELAPEMHAAAISVIRAAVVATMPNVR